MDDQTRMKNDELNPNDENERVGACYSKAGIRRCVSSFLRHSSLVIRHFQSMKLLILTVVMLSSAVFATDENKEKTTPMNSSNEVAVIKTSEGDMVVQFWTDAAPNTVENFKKLARQGFYDGTIFHRIVKEFMIQGGDPNSKDPAKEDSYGQGGPGYNIKAEFNDHSHDRGVISMARGPDPDSAGSQFFICLAPVHRLDHQYTTFGKLIKGQDVLEKIGDTAVTRNSMGEPSKPTKRVVIESIKIVPADSVK
jgi:peptidyl-prolyl cis-trans isomerase B (cyclophilin B)